MTVYEVSPIKSSRAGKSEMEERKTALIEIVGEQQPMTVRQVFYQATVRGIIEKTEAGYGKVQRALVALRRNGEIPYHWIADNTRWQRKPRTFSGPQEALRQTAQFYRKDLWADHPEYVEVWIEKDALAGVVYEITDAYAVPLMVARGYASLSFLHEAGEFIESTGKDAFIYHLGDYDPSGVDAANKIEESLREFAPNTYISFTKLAVLPEQIEEWSLPTRPTKSTDTRAKGFAAHSVELDAIPPDRLRGLVEYAIDKHLPARELEVLKAAEDSERALLAAWANDADVLGHIT